MHARTRCLFFAVSGMLACEPASTTAGGDATTGDAATGDAATGDTATDDKTTGAAAQGCAAETRDDDYVLGLERSGEHVTVRFVDAMPAPPARFDNTWILEVLDVTTGMPVDGVVLEGEARTSNHTHRTSIATKVTVMDAPGQLELDPVNLFMPGLWEVRLHFTMPDAAEDEVVFRFCVDP
jgi:hypothetical protein